MAIYNEIHSNIGSRCGVYMVKMEAPALPKVLFASIEEFIRFAKGGMISDVFCYEEMPDIEGLLKDKGISLGEIKVILKDVNLCQPLLEGVYAIDDRVVYQFERVSNTSMLYVMKEYWGEYKGINLQKLSG